jgi:hypothetical protein
MDCERLHGNVSDSWQHNACKDAFRVQNFAPRTHDSVRYQSTHSISVPNIIKGHGSNCIVL